jgi:hypothetical protein
MCGLRKFVSLITFYVLRGTTYSGLVSISDALTLFFGLSANVLAIGTILVARRSYASVFQGTWCFLSNPRDRQWKLMYITSQETSNIKMCTMYQLAKTTYFWKRYIWRDGVLAMSIEADASWAFFNPFNRGLYMGWSFAGALAHCFPGKNVLSIFSVCR